MDRGRSGRWKKGRGTDGPEVDTLVPAAAISGWSAHLAWLRELGLGLPVDILVRDIGLMFMSFHGQ